MRLFILLALLCCLPLLVSGATTQDSFVLRGSPYYVGAVAQNVNASVSLTVPSYGGGTVINGAVVSLRGYVSPSVVYRLWVDGRACINNNVTLSTIFANAGPFSVDFDCSNVIRSPGRYNVTVRIDKAVNALYVDAVIGTLSRAPEFSVAGTDYEVGDNAKVFTTVAIDGVPVQNASCITKVFYPNSTLFIPYTDMVYLDEGVYYHDFVAPSTVGVYPVIVKCTYVTDHNRFNASSFVRLNGTGGGALSNTYVVDGTTTNFDESAGTNRVITGVFNFSTGSFVNKTLFSISVNTVLRRTIAGGDIATDPINFWLYNYNSSRYIPFVSTFSYTTGFLSQRYTFVANLSQFISPNGNITLLVNDTFSTGAGDTANTAGLDIDFLQIEVDTRDSNESVANIAGGGELNVRRHFGNVNDSINEVKGNLSFLQNDIDLAIMDIGYTRILAEEINQTTHNTNNAVNNMNDNVTTILGIVSGINVSGINASVSLSNDTINDIVTGVSETPTIIDTQGVLLVILILLMIVSAFYNPPGYLILTGMYAAVFGLYMIPLMGVWFGVIILGLGASYCIGGFFKLRS